MEIQLTRRVSQEKPEFCFATRMNGVSTVRYAGATGAHRMNDARQKVTGET